MSNHSRKRSPPHVCVIADVESTARSLLTRVLAPAGITSGEGKPDVLLVDVTQLRGDPLAGLRQRRAEGDETPAIVLAAHFPPSRLRDLFRLGVSDILLKPYRPLELCQAIYKLQSAQRSALASPILSRRWHSADAQLNRRSQEIHLLSEIGRTVTSLSSLDQILTRVVEAATFVTEAEEANIYLAKPGSDEVYLRASKQAGELHGSLLRLRVTDTLVGQVFASGHPLQRQPRFDGDPVKVQTGFLVQSLILVPLRVENQIVGVLGVYNRSLPHPFAQHHLVLLQALATWVGVALDRAALMIQVRESQRTALPAESRGASLLNLLAVIQELDQLRDGTLGPISASQAEHLRRLSADLRRHISDFEDPVVSPRPAEPMVDLSDLVDEVASDLLAQASANDVRIIADEGDQIPPFPADADRMRRVIAALGLSAIRCSPHGVVLIRTHLFEVANGLALNGGPPQGIALRDAHWAAVRFALPSCTLPYDIILALSTPNAEPADLEPDEEHSMSEIRALAEKMGGIIWFEQTTGGGSLIFSLPIGPVIESEG